MIGMLKWLAVLLVALTATNALAAPKRVVSMNLCTDQLAMLVAGEGQLHSVSHLAADPNVSAMPDEAKRYAANYGLAEEVFLMQPDLVLAGTYSTRATTALLSRLGIRVEAFAPEESFDGIRANIRRMGEVLGREQHAAELITAFDRGLAEVERNKPNPLSVATYYANSYTSGAGTLVDEIIRASGLDNAAGELGLSGMARLPLEMLVLADPDLIVDGDIPQDRPALAQQNFVHPAYRALSERRASVAVPAKYTICGAPFTLEAVQILQNAARTVDRDTPK